MLNLLSTTQSHILEKFLVFLLLAPDLYVEITNMYHLRREKDHSLQLVAYHLYTTEITSRDTAFFGYYVMT